MRKSMLRIYTLCRYVEVDDYHIPLTWMGLGALSSNCHHSTLTRLRAGWKALCSWSLTFLSQRDFFPVSKNSLHPPPTRAMARRKWRLAVELDREIWEYKYEDYYCKSQQSSVFHNTRTHTVHELLYVNPIQTVLPPQHTCTLYTYLYMYVVYSTSTHYWRQFHLMIWPCIAFGTN